MSTSEKIRQSDRIGKTCLGVTAFCILFSTVYEIFSHGVCSPSMICLCLYPFFLGALPFAFLKVSSRFPCPEPAAGNLWHSGVATLTMGSLVRGIVEIYGTTTPYAVFYPVAGIGLLIAALVLYFRNRP